MKKVMKSLAIIALAAMSLVGCKKQEFQSPTTDKLIEVSFTAGMPQSKTQINDEGNGIEWQSKDVANKSIEFLEYINGTLNKALYNSGGSLSASGQATFTVNFYKYEGTVNSAIYSAVYPASAFKYNDYDGNKVKIQLAATQTATQASFDPAADLLVAKPIDNGTEQLTSGNHELNFRRINAFAKMTVKNIDIAEDETIKSVSFQANGKELAGIAHIDLSTISEPEWNDTSDEVVVNLSDHNPAAQTFDVWFSCIPATLESGTNYTITVRTNLKTYTKNGTIGAKALEFAAGDVMQFGANFNGVVGVDVVKPNLITDVITISTTGVTSGSYTEFSNKAAVSSALYFGKVAKNSDNIQINSTNPYGIVSTTSGGYVRKISVTFRSGNTNELDIYGSNVAYSSSADLYVTATQGNKLGSITGNSGEIDVVGDYEYIGIRSNKGAIYISSIDIVWEEITTPQILAADIVDVPAIGYIDVLGDEENPYYTLKNIPESTPVTAICDGIIVTDVEIANGALTYEVSPNYTKAERSGSITITAGEVSKVISVIQLADIFTVTPNELFFESAAESTVTINVKSSYPFTISFDEDKIYADNTSYEATEAGIDIELTVYDANETASPINLGDIIIKRSTEEAEEAPNKKYQISATQKIAGNPETLTITMSEEFATATNLIDVTPMTWGKIVNVAFVKINTSSNSNYNTADKGIRLYANDTLTFSITDKKITSITFTPTGTSNKGPITASSGTVDGLTWTGNADSVTITASKQLRFTAITIIYE